MKAMILAAGKGTRLREVTGDDIPKPMVDLGPGPLLEHTVNKLEDFDVDEIIVNLHHRGSVIKEYFGESFGGTPIHYSEEDELLGTAGGIKNVEDRLNDTFIVVYGDILTDLSFADFVDYHRTKNASLSMLVYREDEENLPEASIVLTDDDNRVIDMIEKPAPDTIRQYRDHELWTNGSVFVVEPPILEHVPDGHADMGADVLPALLDELPVYAYPLPADAYWREVGTPERYRAACDDVAARDVFHPPPD